jgi:hypothetical protein
MSHHNAYPKCPRCESILPGGSQHESEAECIAQMIRERKHREYALTRITKQHYQAGQRAESWKLKAKAAWEANTSPSESIIGKRLDKLEARADASETRVKQLLEEIGQLNQRVKFLMGQLAPTELRRAS